MFSRTPCPASIERLGAAQAGVISTEQMRLAGVPAQSVRRLAERWTRIGQGVYCMGEVSWRSLAWAGVLRGGKGASLGGAAACRLHGLLATDPMDITVWVSDGRPAWSVDEARITYRRGSRSVVGEPPRTRVEEALLDLAYELDEDQLVAAVTKAFADRRTLPGRLLGFLNARSAQRHRRLLAELCQTTGVESVLEWRYLELVERRHGLPPLSRQVQTWLGRVDGCYEEFGVIVELDGRAFHDAQRDMARDNSHALLGATTLRYGWHDVNTRPCFVARQVAQVLEARGWAGVMRRCRRCKRMKI